MQGVVTSLVTPFRHGSGSFSDDGATAEIDVDCLRAILKAQVRAGVEAVAVAGWIGEGSTLGRAERALLVATAKETCRGRAKVLAHVGTCDTARSIAFAADAAMRGADGIIVVTPPYSRPNAAGLRRHVSGIAETTILPIYLEFDPDRTRSPISVRDMIALADIPGVAGIIDHSPNVLHVECMSAARGPECFLTASEANCFASLALGGDGVFSAVANILPLCMVELELASRTGHVDTARAILADLMPLMHVIEEEGPPAVKYAMAETFHIAPDVRLPLMPLAPEAAARVDAALATAAELRAAIEMPRRLRMAQ